MPPKQKGRPASGTIEALPSGKYRVRFTGPDRQRHVAPVLFEDKVAANIWLGQEHGRIALDPEGWIPPKRRLAEAAAARALRADTFAEYATKWISERKVKGRPLADRTKDHYQSLLENYLSPTFGSMSLDDITPQMVNAWYDALTIQRKREGDTGNTTKAHTYSLARSIMTTACGVHGPIVGRVNPFAVRGAGSTQSAKRTELVSSSELEIILATIRPEWRAMVQIALWTGLRFGELAELRRSDIDLEERMIHVRRAVSRSKVGGVRTKDPKSEAGKRDREIPDSIMPIIKAHLRTNVTGRDGLLFPGKDGQHLAPSTFYGRATCTTCRKVPKVCARQQRDGRAEDHEFEPRESGWYAARVAAGHPSLHFHDLRATGATLMAQNGATEAEIMEWLGDSTPQAAQRYVRAAKSRMRAHADAMSKLAEGGQW